MVSKTIKLNEVASKKFLGNTVERLGKGTLTLEELEITSKLIVEVPDRINLIKLKGYVATRDKIVVEVWIQHEFEKKRETVTRYQEFILEYFEDDSIYKWKHIKERCFDEEIPVVLMEYSVFFENSHEEDSIDYLSTNHGIDIDEDDLDKYLDMKNAKARLEMSVRLKRNKKKNAQNERIVKVVSEEILSDSDLVKDIFYDTESCKQNIFGRTHAIIYDYLCNQKKVEWMVASDVSMKISREAVRYLRNRSIVSSEHSSQAQLLVMELFSCNHEMVMEMDSKSEILDGLRRFNERIYVNTLISIPATDIYNFVDRNQDKIKEMISELRKDYGYE